MRASVLAVACLLSSAVAFAAKPGATAEVKDGEGKVVGKATFTQEKDGVKVNLTASGLKPGKHGVHIHAMGKCDGPDFKTAGPHFNPDKKQHGQHNPQGSHAGDLGNFTVDSSGSGKLSTVSKGASLAEGANTLLSADGTALVIHADADDEKTDPSGNSGARIACGVIQKS